MNMHPGLDRPLTFRPVYQHLVWGGRRMEAWRDDMPDGPIGEAWDVSDHPRGMSVVEAGPLAGQSLSQLVADHGPSLVSAAFRGAVFPLMVKLIDATDRLSVQVHPDDALARKFGVGDHGKAECWYLLANDGELYVGSKPGVDRTAFETALGTGHFAGTLNVFPARSGDVFSLAPRTVHALGSGCLLLEIQQTSDVTFRVYDWGRTGLDGKPRQLHAREALETIDFSPREFGPLRSTWAAHPDGGEVRRLVDGPFFTLEERRVGPGQSTTADDRNRCAVISCVEGTATIETDGGATSLGPTRSALVPAAAGRWTLRAPGQAVRALISMPCW